MLVSALAGLVVPDTGVSDRVLLSGRNDAPLVADTPVLPVPRTDDIRLFKATGVPDGRRLRLAVLDLYDGAAWIPAEDSPGSDGYGTFKRVGPAVTALHPGTTAVVRVTFRPGYSSDWLPMLGELTSIDFDFNPGRTDVGDVRYNQATASALVLGGVDVRDEYRFESVVGDVSFTRRDPTREPTEEQRQPGGAFLDEYLQPFDRRELLPLERVLLLARYLRTHGTVRTTENFDQSPDMLGHRMLGSQRMTGTAFQYSALMALGASRLGVAARLVTGAEPGRGGLVDYGDLTSWVELQFEDGTWRPLDLDRYLGSRVLEEGAEPVPAPDPAEFVREQLDQASTGQGQGDPPALRLLRVPSWPAGGPGGRGLRRRRSASQCCCSCRWLKQLRRARRRRTSSWSGVYVNGWQEVLDAARDRGTPVPEGWSRAAQAAQLGVPRGSRPLGGRRRLRARSAAGGGRPRLLGRLPAAATRRGRGGGVAASVVVPPQPRLAHRRLGPRPSVSPAGRATKIAVPGVSSPRARDQPPQTRSFCSGHSGSTRSTSRKSCAASRRTQSPSVRWCST